MRLDRIAVILAEGFTRLESQLSSSSNNINSAPRNNPLAYNNRHLRHDKDLRYPHLKILDFLDGEFDSTKNEFKEVHFSKLVKESRVGKNMAKSYLSLLEQKGYIQKRSDGYRIFFKLRR